MPQEKINQLLLNLIRFDGIPVCKNEVAGLSPADWQALCDLAIKLRVIVYLYHCLKEQALLDAAPENIRQFLMNLYLQNAARNMRLYNEFLQVAGAFKAASIQLIALKGIYLAKAIYRNIALRQMNDIDLLVRQEDLAAAGEILLRMGYRPDRPYSLDWDLSHKHLPPFSRPDACTVELHWNITHRNMPYSIEPEEIWNHSCEAHSADYPARALSPEDILLLLCKHNSYGHHFNFGLCPYVDTGMTIEFFGDKLNWDVIVESAVSRNWAKGVYLTLELTRELTGAGVPDDVLEALKPAGMDDAIIREAYQLLFNDKDAGSGITRAIALTADRGFFGIVNITLQRIFISKSKLADQYLVPPDSKKIYFYYPVWAKELILLHYKTMWDVHFGKKGKTDKASRMGILISWLEE